MIWSERTYLETRVDADTEKNVDFAWVATALASIVYCQLLLTEGRILFQFQEDQRATSLELVHADLKTNLVEEMDK